MSPSHLPDDQNGNVLRRMLDGGDDLSRPRIVDFCFVFPERQQAMAFAEMFADRDLQISISYFAERQMWQSIVKRHMLPTHRDITQLESRLASQARTVGGKADGWGCLILTPGVVNAQSCAPPEPA